MSKIDAISIENLTFAYKPGKPILKIDSFQMEKGEHLFLHGPSGTGKTTLLGILAGILDVRSSKEPSNAYGDLKVLGYDLKNFSGHQKDAWRGSHIGYIFQMFNLIPYLGVIDNILLPIHLNPERKKRLKNISPIEAAHALAHRLGLGPYVLTPVTELSVGQQQRVAAARALIGNPELIIADEPTSALDQDHRGLFLELLFSEAKSYGASILFVSHDRTLESLFHRVVALREINKAIT